MIARVRTMDSIVEHVGLFESIRKADLRRGDQVVIQTENSVYRIQVQDEGAYSIRGGWFDRNGLSPTPISIVGCTWGGTAIKRDLVAACGLRLEFGNRVVTSRIREVRVIRRGEMPDIRGLRPLGSRELYAACYGSPGDSGSS